MPSIDDLEPVRAARLVELLGRLKHDLGKYVALQQRWLAPDADADERERAVRADLLSTRRGPNGQVDALAVWEDFARALDAAEMPDIRDDPDRSTLAVAMAEVGEVIAALQAGPVDVAVLDRAGEASLAASEACRRLARRARRRAEGAWPTSS